MENETTSTTSTCDVLKIEHIQEAIKTLKEAGNRKHIVDIRSRHEWWKLLKKDHTIRGYFVYAGVPVYKDEEIPKGIARVNYSDGTHEDINICSSPNFLPTA